MSTAIFDFTRSRSGRSWVRIAAALLLALALALMARPLLAQTAPAAAPAANEQTTAAPDTAREAASQAAATAPAAGEPDPAAVAQGSTDAAAPGAPGAAGYTPMKPTPGIGMPVERGLDVQEQFSPTGRYAEKFHIAMVWVMGVISVFVLALLVYVMWRFRASRNPVPSRTTHHTGLEVAWTLVPVLILVAIAIPSISLLQQQYRTPPADAVTIKATGYQWYWGYSYPDNGEFEVISNMLSNEEADARGEPRNLAADNRMVVPAGVPLRIQATAADVIHAFAVPSLWFKIDAVPGRLNERMLTIEKPGVYYGQCSELCGVRHGYMPIVVEALPMEQWRAWVRAQGGTFADDASATPTATPAAAPLQDPESAVPNAPGAGAPPVAPATPTPAAQ
ncbi:MAG TPA: cytochrome c oxidase subunit II [Qipengyuania sp.]|nr:cytochrome c oxidase subunit II [Qipengyuania sp.]